MFGGMKKRGSSKSLKGDEPVTVHNADGETIQETLRRLETHYFSIKVFSAEKELTRTIVDSVEDVTGFCRALLRQLQGSSSNSSASRREIDKAMQALEKKHKDPRALLQTCLGQWRAKKGEHDLLCFLDIFGALEECEHKEPLTTRHAIISAILTLGNKYVRYPEKIEVAEAAAGSASGGTGSDSRDSKAKASLVSELELYQSSQDTIRAKGGGTLTYQKQQSYDHRNNYKLMEPAGLIELPPNVRRIKTLGSGAFATVYHCRDENSELDLAVKLVRIPSSASPTPDLNKDVKLLMKEINLMKSLSHRNIVQYYGSVTGPSYLSIFMEYMEKGTIKDVIKLKGGCLSEERCLQYTREVLQGLKYLHSKNVVHRDLKCANILINGKGDVKLADFGCSKAISTMATIAGGGGGEGQTVTMGQESIVGSPYWMPPEIIKQTGHSWSADIWAVGCVVVEMVTGQPPYSHMEPWAAMFHIAEMDKPMQPLEKHPKLAKSLSQPFKDMMLQCLEKTNQRDPKLMQF